MTSATRTHARNALQRKAMQGPHYVIDEMNWPRREVAADFQVGLARHRAATSPRRQTSARNRDTTAPPRRTAAVCARRSPHLPCLQALDTCPTLRPALQRRFVSAPAVSLP